MYLKFMKGVSTSKERNIFRHCYLTNNVALEKIIA